MKDIGTEQWFCERFYIENIKPQLDKKGEAYLEWLSNKKSVIQIANYLRSKYRLNVIWMEKHEDVFSIWVKEK